MRSRHDLGHDVTMSGTSPTTTGAVVERRLQLGLGAVRAVTLVWAAVVAGIDAASGVLTRPAPAFAVLAVLAVWSTAWTSGAARRASWVGRTGVVVDLALAAAAVALDPFVYPGSRPQSFGSAWPLTAVLATGVAAGPVAGLGGGLLVGAAGVVGAATDGAVGGRVLALSGATVLYALGGWVAGWVARELRTSADVVATAAARAEVARTLHDGVLQTLAVVQRRSDDASLVELARRQDAELRAYLRGTVTRPVNGGSVDERLGPALAEVESRFEVPVRLVVVDTGTAQGHAADALVRATAEVATNAAKHSGATHVWVSVDRGDPSGTMVVVLDEGRGFDPAATPDGDGMRESVRGRLADVGGSVEVRSAPGTGCEVTLWVP